MIRVFMQYELPDGFRIVFKLTPSIRPDRLERSDQIQGPTPIVDVTDNVFRALGYSRKGFVKLKSKPNADPIPMYASVQRDRFSKYPLYFELTFSSVEQGYKIIGLKQFAPSTHLPGPEVMQIKQLDPTTHTVLDPDEIEVQ